MSGSLLAGWFAPLAIYIAILILHLSLPARRVEGYAVDAVTGRPLTYRLNGLLVFAVVVGIWLAAGEQGWLSRDWLYATRWSAMGGACLVGLAYSTITVLGARPTGRPFLADLYLGRRENPQHLGKRVDAKMFLYLAGAVMLGLNTLSAAAFHAIELGEGGNPGVYLHAALLTFFVLDYLVFERVHLYTYDLFAERVGLKLGWGCLAFYPFFYPVGLWGTAHLGEPSVIADLGWIWLSLSALVFLSGWVLARGANLQKYVFKRFPERAFLGRFPPRVIRGGNLTLLVELPDDVDFVHPDSDADAVTFSVPDTSEEAALFNARGFLLSNAQPAYAYIGHPGRDIYRRVAVNAVGVVAVERWTGSAWE